MRYRPVLVVILLSIVTLGLYTLFWLYYTRKEMVAHGQRIPPIWLLLAPFLLLVLIAVLQFLSAFVLNTVNGDTLTASHGVLGTLINVVSLLAALAAVFGFLPIAIYWFYRYCQAIEAVTHKGLLAGESIALLIILSIFGVGFVWPGIVQNSFNRIAP